MMNTKPFLNYFLSLRNQLVLSTTLTGISIQQSFCSSDKPKNKHYKFNFGSTMIPHPEKVHKGGEDALYVSPKLIAVADGVGGWAELGIDPGLYSKELCQRIKSVFEGRPELVGNPKQVIIEAAKLNKQIGSTTVCLLSLDGDVMRASFVGDSGYAIYRKSGGGKFELVFKSKEQQKSFNFPYQIGSEGDDPSCAFVDSHNVQIDDLVVLGTDGLFDNMNAGQIKVLLDEQKTVDAQQISRVIANYAYKLSLDPRYESPFAKAAYEARLRFMGGKSDDITVVVGLIKEDEQN